MPSFKDGVNRTFFEEVNENPCHSHNHDTSLPKAQGGSTSLPNAEHEATV